MAENLELIDALVEAGFSSTNARDLAEMLGGAGLSSATLEDGVAKFTIEGQQFAMLPVDDDGGLTANIGHRRAPLANLLSLDGVNGEISVPTDSEDLVIHNGIAGQARRFRSAVSNLSAGTDSIAIGAGASTDARARNSLALGAGASAQTIGETVFAGGIAGVETRILTFGARSTSASPVFGTATGVANDATPGASASFTPGGVYDAEIVVLARQIGANNWARFVRRATIFIENTGGAATLANQTTPTPDVNSGLAGLSISLISFPGIPIIGQFTGLASTTIQWAMFVRLSGLSITV